MQKLPKGTCLKEHECSATEKKALACEHKNKHIAFTSLSSGIAYKITYRCNLCPKFFEDIIKPELYKEMLSDNLINATS